MKRDRTEGRFSMNGRGLGTVTEDMIWQRAGELAEINGRTRKNILDIDLEQACRELTGGERLVPENTAAENLPEDERWDPNSGSAGTKVESVPAPDEQTFAEKLVEEGVADAEHDQEVQATRASLRRDEP